MNRNVILKTLVSIHSDEMRFYVEFTRRLCGNSKPIREKQW